MSATIRNVAIIAHVDHGKTTLVDQLLHQSGTFRENQAVAERVMDSMDLEREKGITIKAKNTSIRWQDPEDPAGEEVIINIVDTPGHADFGAEVERVMRMVDGVLLLCDAVEGPQAQTRWVLRKALSHGLSPIVVINKVDRDHAQPEAIHDKVLELFLDLDATEEQFNAPFLYASAKEGFADPTPDGPRQDMQALYRTIVQHVPQPVIEEDQPFRMLISNIDWDDYVGRIAVGRILSGSVKQGDSLYRLQPAKPTPDSPPDSEPVFPKPQRAKITRLLSYAGLKTADTAGGDAGDIIGLAGFEDVDIGDTLAAEPEAERLPFVEIDPPTIQMEFCVNDGPLAGRDGDKVTSRQIRDRLEREMKSNISIQLDDSLLAEEGTSTRMRVNARGAMQIAVLVETMRREGYEVLVSRPTVLVQKEEGSGRLLEPYEQVWVEVPSDQLGGVMDSLSQRKGTITNLTHHHAGVTVEAEVPTRGLIGFESQLVNLTSGHGVMSHLFLDYRPWAGEITTRHTGTLVAMDQGKASSYSLTALQDRGRLFIAPGDEVYTGQVVGENPRREDLPVNPTKEKHLDNMRSATADKTEGLTPPIKFSLERAIEYIEPDEFVEATPNHLRLRKRILDPHQRKREQKRLAEARA